MKGRKGRGRPPFHKFLDPPLVVVFVKNAASIGGPADAMVDVMVDEIVVTRSTAHSRSVVGREKTSMGWE